MPICSSCRSEVPEYAIITKYPKISGTVVPTLICAACEYHSEHYMCDKCGGVWENLKPICVDDSTDTWEWVCLTCLGDNR
jgi:predicted RNA-binding Zn-ribbon protein involved in translation (DUF1610 family)